MAYTRTTWVDNVTPLSAKNMNNIEEGLTATKGSVVLADTIPAKSTITKNIPLGDSYSRGKLLFSSNISGHSAFVACTTIADEAIACGFFGTYIDFVIRKNVDSLSRNASSGIGCLGTNYVLLNDAYIVGTDLFLEFYNDNTSERSLATTLYWEMI